MVEVLDAAWNLAAEEWWLTALEGPSWRVWRNSPSVIIGRNQNAYAEIDMDFVESRGIQVVRRLSGGGAVFHDEGNVNYSFYNVPKTQALSMIVSVLQSLGLDVSTSGRNDILLAGQKISGVAECRQGSHTLVHGTLLFDASMDALAGALKPRKEKFEGKAVKSVRSRVTNIREHLSQDMSVEEFMGFIINGLSDFGLEPPEQVGLYQSPSGDSGSRAGLALRDSKAEAAGFGAGPQYYSGSWDEIEHLRQTKYATREWNFGRSPGSAFSSVRKFPAGLVELYMDIAGGNISHLDVKGDYFFRRPTEEFCERLIGCPYEREAIAARLGNLPLDDYFSGISQGELLTLFF